MKTLQLIVAFYFRNIDFDMKTLAVFFGCLNVFWFHKFRHLSLMFFSLESLNCTIVRSVNSLTMSKNEAVVQNLLTRINFNNGKMPLHCRRHVYNVDSTT